MKQPLIKNGQVNHDIDVVALDRERIEKVAKLPGVPFVYEDVEKCLNDVYTMQESCLVDFIFLGDMAKSLKENRRPTIVPEIDLVMSRNQLTKEVKSLFETWKFTQEPYGYSYEYSVPIKWHIKIPVKIYVYNQKFKLFDNPDVVWSGWDKACVPNPFPNYWKARHFIKAKLQKGLPLSSEVL